MYKIILVCQHGASTDMVSVKMEAAVKELNLDATVNAYSYMVLDQHIDQADIVLLAPQVRFKLEEFKRKYADLGIPFMVIQAPDYGMLNGKKILQEALELLEANN